MDDKAAALGQQIDEAMASLTEKLGKLEHQVSDKVNAIKESVHTVRDTLDVKLQVRKRPWTFVTGAAAVGFLAGLHRNNHRIESPIHNGKHDEKPLAPIAAVEHPHPAVTGSTNGAAAQTAWWVKIGKSFEPEIAELKGIAIGIFLGLVREMMTNQAPRPMKRSVEEPVDVSGSNPLAHRHMEPDR